jgi:hypothetical protein
LHGALRTAGYATDQISGFFDGLGGDFATAGKDLDLSNW